MAANADEPAVSPDASPHSHRQAEAQNLLVHDSNTVDFPRDQPADRPDEPGHQIAETDASKSKAEPFEVLKGPGFLSLVYTRWLTELLASLIALLAFAAIVITLATHNGRPLPNWPFGISINALVSIFAVILKGTMMVPVAESVSQLKWSWYKEPRPLSDLVRFDQASRGIWGAARLIEGLRGIHLASLGAAITILAVASDPFIQQVIKYHPCPQIVGPGMASLSRSSNYTQSGIHTGALQESLDLPMQAAIYDGVYNSFYPVEPICTTGNCTFFDFRTVGMCSGCQDISSTINTTCNRTSHVEGGYSCLWQLPSGLNLSIPAPTAMAMEPASSQSLSDNTEVSTVQIISFTSVLEYNKDHLVNDTNGLRNVMALECSLYPCVRTYSAGVTGGKMSETLVSTEKMTQNSASPFASFSASPMPCLINGTSYNSSSFIKHNSTDSIPISGLLEHNQTAYLPKECYFVYDRPLGLEQYLPSFLAGYVIDAPEDDYASPAWMGQLYNSGNATLATVNATWTALAESMTVRIRQAPDGSNLGPASGDAWHTETCISVQWLWLTFPAVLLLLAIVFLLATITQSVRRSRELIWKASPLALLFHGLDDDLKERFRLVDHTDEMEQTAKELSVKIGYDEGVMRFTQATRTGA